jgi:hypothetical protein
VFCYKVEFRTVFTFTTLSVAIFIRITQVRMVSHFLEIRLAFCFFFWVIGELVRTSPWRFLLTPNGPEFDNFWWRGKFHENFVW